ncbi:protein shisa-5 isoform X1 [Hippopotamus amphibius kiboko]|uniref:protein shisa-5 isoform X1 n=1 Tax=Hippopotamus amphibius kiboko TaxID=575201 RepID=UPI00259787E9|nr:protein shisa-5 isoform X1 [Hippopotamus amphibius kiboko]
MGKSVMFRRPGGCTGSCKCPHQRGATRAAGLNTEVPLQPGQRLHVWVWHDCGRRPDHLCALHRHRHHLLYLLLLLLVQDVPPTTSGCDDHHGHHGGAHPLHATSKCAAQLPWTNVPGLPLRAPPARDASSTLPHAVPTTLPGPAYGPPRLPRDNGWRCSHALPSQPASLQSGLHGPPEGSPLRTPSHLWPPLDLSCEWVCRHGVPFSPGVWCVYVLFVYEASRDASEEWGTILARAAGTTLCSLSHLKLCFLKSQAKFKEQFFSRPPQGNQVGLSH